MRPLGFGEIEELALSDSVGARWQMPAPSPNSLGPESELSVHRTILSILSLFPFLITFGPWSSFAGPSSIHSSRWWELLRAVDTSSFSERSTTDGLSVCFQVYSPWKHYCKKQSKTKNISFILSRGALGSMA